MARLRISARTAEKLASKHGLDAGDVRDAVQCVAGLLYAWDFDEERGWRAIVRTSVRGRDCYVVLYDAGDGFGDVYNLGSAYETGGGRL